MSDEHIRANSRRNPRSDHSLAENVLRLRIVAPDTLQPPPVLGASYRPTAMYSPSPLYDAGLTRRERSYYRMIGAHLGFQHPEHLFWECEKWMAEISSTNRRTSLRDSSGVVTEPNMSAPL